MKIKITALFSAIAAVLAAMEVKATDKDKGSVYVPIHSESVPVHSAAVHSVPAAAVPAAAAAVPESAVPAVPESILRQLASYFVRNVRNVRNVRIRKGKLIKFAAVAAGLLIAGYTLYNYFSYDPEYQPWDSLEKRMHEYLMQQDLTAEQQELEKQMHELLKELPAKQSAYVVPKYLPDPKDPNLPAEQLKLNVMKKLHAYLLKDYQQQPELLGMSHAQQERTGSKWVAAGLSTLALVAISALALILWNLKNQKKTGQKAAPFSSKSDLGSVGLIS